MNSPLPFVAPLPPADTTTADPFPSFSGCALLPVFAVAYIPTALGALSSVGMTSWASLSEGEGGGISSQSRDAQGSLGGWADSYLMCCVACVLSSRVDTRGRIRDYWCTATLYNIRSWGEGSEEDGQG